MNTENVYIETDLGNVSPNPRGEYSTSELYEYLDLVYYEGGSYICTADPGKTICGISPEAGKDTEYWQCVAIPGDMTPDYIAMHDRVVNLSEQVDADAEEVRENKESVESMKANVQVMQEQASKDAASAEESKTEAAGYAHSADISRKATETAEADVTAKVDGFDEHVSSKTQEVEEEITNARKAAIGAIVSQEKTSVESAKAKLDNYLTEKEEELDASAKVKFAEYGTSVDEDIETVKEVGKEQVAKAEAAEKSLKETTDIAESTKKSLEEDIEEAKETDATLNANNQSASAAERLRQEAEERREEASAKAVADAEKATQAVLDQVNHLTFAINEGDGGLDITYFD